MEYLEENLDEWMGEELEVSVPTNCVAVLVETGFHLVLGLLRPASGCQPKHAWLPHVC